MDQILKKTTTDSLGNFNYEGNNLINENRIYRIHLEECPETVLNSGHFFGSFEISKSILFKTKRQFEGRNKATFSVDFEYPSRD